MPHNPLDKDASCIEVNDPDPPIIEHASLQKFLDIVVCFGRLFV